MFVSCDIACPITVTQIFVKPYSIYLTSMLLNIIFNFSCFRERLSTEQLHLYLSAALNVDKNQETNEIELIKEKKFVLTRDFVQKMLNIHERKECCIPVVIEGETGVGKTFLVEILACLWNESWNQQLIKRRKNMNVSNMILFFIIA